MKVERIDPHKHLVDWERIYDESLNGVIFAHPRWSILAAEYSGGEPRFWTVFNEEPVGYLAGIFYNGRDTLVMPVFDPIFAPYSDFTISPPYRKSVLETFFNCIKGDSYKKVLIGPLRDDSPNAGFMSSMAKPIHSQRIYTMKMKGDPLEHLYRQKAYNFITSFENMNRKLHVEVEMKDFGVLDKVLNFSHKLGPAREFALKSVLTSCKDKVRIIEVLEKGKTLGYTVLVDTGSKLYVILNTVPENKILLGIWRYLYDSKKRNITIEVPFTDKSTGSELGFKSIQTRIYELNH